MKPLTVTIALVLFILCALRQPSKAQQGTLTAFSEFTITNGHLIATNFLGTNLKAMKVTLIGLQAGGLSNTTAVFVGPTTNGAQKYLIAPGSRHVIETQPATYIMLNSWWLRVTTEGDGLTVIYQ